MVRAMNAPAQPRASVRPARAVSVAVAQGLAARGEGELIACPRCDALLRAVVPRPGGRARCVRCGTVLIAPRGPASVHVLGLSVAVMVLMLAAVFLPFISISAGGLRSQVSIVGAALAFAGGPLAPLSVAVLAMIVLVPVARVALILWAFGPVMTGRPPLPGARAAFRLDEELKPWSMAEIFVIGTSIALVKIGELAAISLGPAFWLFGALVAVGVLQDALMDRWSLWRALEAAERAGRP